ncbi:hypothetical protein JOF29_002557 [Kribbella aluminosa]|uniref:Methane monooxygenase PmoA-like n=1 Tax=Kribbella aluminosa TaxID=416017 RepID=A0ABS4UIW5_9ACTN|nr:PmoA family protein [Kribbella aluminosa]MBP2351474.1 hypothetical protein [Kribbella aluminosa]
MPSSVVLSVREDDKALSISCGETELGRYVFMHDDAGYEAPKPYMHPIRSLSGAVLTSFRPWDHRWHKGLQMTWSHVSGQNFWGGPTFLPDRGYQNADNVGRIEHAGFDEVTCTGDRVQIDEKLSWITSTGERWIDEHRRHTVGDVDAGRGLWALTLNTRLRNGAGRPLDFGSPTTQGRPQAGYTGLFCRGPRSWTGGRILAPAALAIAGRSSAAAPIKWFVRREPFAAIAPSPSFDDEIVLADDQTLALQHRFVFVDHVCDTEELEALGAEFAL